MKIVLVGGGALALEVMSYLQDMRNANTISEDTSFSILDGGEPRMSDFAKIKPGVKYFKDYEDIENIDECFFSIAVAEPGIRKKIYLELHALNLNKINVIHPSSYISPTAVVEDGVIVGPFAFIGPLARIEKGGLMNTYASIGHDAILGAYSTLSPYAALNGFAKTGEVCFLGSQATISPSCSLGNRSKLSAGSILTTDTEDGSLAHGNPAKFRVMFR